MTPPSLFSPAIPPAHFLYQSTAECYFQSNGSEARSGPTPPPPRVRFLERHFYDRQEIVRFDSDRGEFEAVTTLGEPDAEYWNSQKDLLEDARRAADYFCRHNYGLAESFASGRKSKRVPGGGRASGAGGSVNGAGKGSTPGPQTRGACRQPPPDKDREGK
nr:HLA class II histocompatibility antigen, DRB1-15 beta chain-like [Pogona vitticeps]